MALLPWFVLILRPKKPAKPKPESKPKPQPLDHETAWKHLPPKQRAFLAAIANVANISWAANASGFPREYHYRLLKIDPAYKAAFAEAWEMGCGSLEDLAQARARDGVLEPVFYQGEECGFVTRYYHLEFLLRGAMPHKYREQVAVKHTGKVDTGMKKFAGTLEDLLIVYRELAAKEDQRHP